MDDGYWQILLFVLIIVGLAAAILVTGDWLRRKRIANRFPNVDTDEVEFHLPCRFEYTSTTEDLLQAYEMERRSVSGLRRAVRWFVVGMGFAWLLGVVVFWRKATTLQLAIWGILGVGILWGEVIKPFLKRREIRTTEAESQNLVLEFAENGIHYEIEGLGAFDRTWKEFVAVIDTDVGVLLYFEDGIANWLPRRIFPNNTSKAKLHSFLVKRMAENDEQQMKEG